MQRGGGWEWAGGIDPTEPRSWRGGLPHNAALKPAMHYTALGIHRMAMVVAANAGSGNFNFSVPIANYPGRGERPCEITLIYNSRVWQRVDGISPPTSTMVFDIDHDWPAPGWSLGFGRMVGTGYRRCMLTE